MKRILVATIMMIGLMNSTAVSGPIAPPCAVLNKGAFKVGLSIYSGERDMNNKNESSQAISVSNTRTRLSVFYGILDTVTVFGDIGVADASSYDAQVFINKGFGLYDAPIIGLGIKTTFLQKDQWQFGGAFHISQYKSDQYEEAGSWNATLDYEMTEFDLAVGAVYSGNKSVDYYGGILFSKIDGTASIVHHYNGAVLFDGTDDFENSDPVGLFAGLEYKVSERVLFVFEGQLIHEDALKLGLMMAF